MKKKLRIFCGRCSRTIGVPVALAVVLIAGTALRLPAQTPTSVLGVPCSSVKALGIDKQTNIRAGLIRVGCGLEPAVQLSTPQTVSIGAPALNLTVTNVNTITGAEVFPKVTQSESMVWSSDGTTIVVNYNDSGTSPGNFSGVSVSTDGGATFTRLLPAPFATGHGNNFGDPIVVFNSSLSTWFAGDLATDCGGQGIGLWTSPDGLTWTPGACAHMNISFAGDDRESMWVDNNPASPFYGRMYISYNNFAIGEGRLEVVASDDGVTWSEAVPLTTGLIRDVQLTGAPDSGSVFVAAMNEGGGGFNDRTNIIFRSTDGGVTWTEITMGDPFAPPGDSLCSNPIFARVFPIWRHMGWGQPGVGAGGIIHYAYAGAGLNPEDFGDIYYTRSADNGDTWSVPIVLNTDQAGGGTGTQWMPSLSVTSNNKVTVAWYDRRNTTDGLNYEYWMIQSLDNGMTWQPDVAVSDVLIPQPLQPDPRVQSCYAGDYNYHSSFGTTSYMTWTDGRNLIDGNPQQDVYFAQQP